MSVPLSSVISKLNEATEKAAALAEASRKQRQYYIQNSAAVALSLQASTERFVVIYNAGQTILNIYVQSRQNQALEKLCSVLAGATVKWAIPPDRVTWIGNLRAAKMESATRAEFGFNLTQRHKFRGQYNHEQKAQSDRVDCYNASTVPPKSPEHSVSYAQCVTITQRVGFDIPMSIIPFKYDKDSNSSNNSGDDSVGSNNGGDNEYKSIFCAYAGCADAKGYPRDKSKIHVVSATGMHYMVVFNYHLATEIIIPSDLELRSVRQVSL